MAYLVLALGAFLSIGGALSIINGASIVEVERGWTGVIAGATALTGGIVVIALGLLLRALLDLRATLAERAPAGTVPAAVGLPGIDIAAIGPTAAPRSLPPMTEAQAHGNDLDEDLLAAFLAPSPEDARHPEPEPAALLSERAGAAPVAGSLYDAAPAALDEVAVGGEPEPPKPRFRIGLRRPAAPPASPIPAPPASAEAASVPAMDDWLDRAFSTIDEDVAAGQSRPEGLGFPDEPAAAAPEVSYHDHGAAITEPAPAPLQPIHALEPEPVPPVHTEPAAPQPAVPPVPVGREPTLAAPAPAIAEAAVIGRYEADGTSYVMFADGSIEAQSDAGIYRFRSMSELKAFIEGTA